MLCFHLDLPAALLVCLKTIAAAFGNAKDKMNSWPGMHQPSSQFYSCLKAQGCWI